MSRNSVVAELSVQSSSRESSSAASRRSMSTRDDGFAPLWDESPHDSPNIDDDLLLPVAVASFEAASSNQSEASSVRKWRVTVLMVRTLWRLRWSLEKRHQQFPCSPLSRWRACAYLVFAVRRLKVTLPRLRAKRARGMEFLLKMQSEHKWLEKPMLHIFRSTAYGVLFASMLSTRVSRNHNQCAPLNDAVTLLSAASKAKLDDSLNSGKCKALLQILSVLETYLKIFKFILDNIAKQTTRIEGLSACYYILKEICRLLTQCTQYIRDCSGNFPSRRLFAKLESLSTIRGLILDIDRCLELLSIKVDKLVEMSSSSEHCGIKPTSLRLFGPGMDYYLQLQAEKDQSDLLLKLKQSTKSFWLGLDLRNWRNKVERQLLIARLEYDKKPGREIDYLQHGLCVDPKNVKVERPLGVGSYGTVQEVECFGERYAMKTIVSSLENASEAIIQAGLEHPNIVKLIWYTTNVDPKSNINTLSLLMELMDMGLDAYLEQRNHERKPPLMKYQLVALHILLQIARAMKYLHSQQIMHRDLKAANVLVDLSWSPDFKFGYLHVKVCDFGLSKVKQAGAGANLYTAKVGTRYWRAPEVLRPDNSTEVDTEDGERARYSFSADVYSYAMTCYEVLTGKKPFAEHKQAGLKDRIATMNERPRLPEDDLHAGLVDLIKRCWDGRPEVRPSFDVICEELEHVKEELLFGSGCSRTPAARPRCEENLLLAM